MNKIIHYILIAFVLIVLIALLYPRATINRVRVEQAIARSDLKQILISCRGYAEKNEGQLPPDWSALFTNYMSIDGLSCFVTRQNRDKIGAPDKVMEWTDYIYVRNLNTSSPPRTVFAFLPSGHIKSKTPYIVAYLDGSTVALGLSDFTKEMNTIPQPAGPGYPPQGVGSPDP